MKRFVTLALAVVAFTLTGCGSDETTASSDGGKTDGSASESAAGPVSLNGTFRIGGGPTPGIDEPLGGTVTFDGPVTETASAADGVFTVDLPPGDYTVTAQPIGHFAAAYCPIGSVSVEVAQTEPLIVGCIVE